MDDAESPHALRLVGALLVGAALAAVVRIFVPLGAGQPTVALALALGALLAARRYARLEGDARAGEPALAVALVAAGSVPFFAASPPLLGALAALAVLVATLLARARTPLALLGVVCFYVDARHATGSDMLRGSALAAELAFVLALLAYAVLLARQRAGPWGGHALAAQGAALTLALFPLLDALGVTDAGVAALALCALLSTLFGLALRLRARPLALVSGGLLALAATALAFLALGPALAAIALLLLGAALVWRAEALRGYFRPRAA